MFQKSRSYTDTVIHPVLDLKHSPNHFTPSSTSHISSSARGGFLVWWQSSFISPPSNHNERPLLTIVIIGRAMPVWHICKTLLFQFRSASYAANSLSRCSKTVCSLIESRSMTWITFGKPMSMYLECNTKHKTIKRIDFVTYHPESVFLSTMLHSRVMLRMKAGLQVPYGEAYPRYSQRLKDNCEEDDNGVEVRIGDRCVR